MSILTTDYGKPIRSKENFLVFGAPLIEEPEIEEVVGCMRRGWIGTEPKAHQFEQNFKTFKASKYAMALNSCTAALHLSMFAAGIGPGDEIITTPMTFCSTINAIIHCGATPVLADCDRNTMNILPQEIEKKLTARTKAILPVHFAGRCCDMDAIMEIARKYDLLVIEDCAHAIESEYHGRKAGRFGNIGCFSFYVTKNVITGEGGMVITDDDRFAERIKVFGLHGMSKDAWKRFSDDGYKHYQVIHAGYKYNMMDIQAAIGIHQLKRVGKYWARRQNIWQEYNEAFRDLPCATPPDPEPDTRHAYHLYTPLIDIDKFGKSRDWVLNALTTENIGVGVHYLPVHPHPYYRKMFGWKQGDFPNAEWIGERMLSLPLSAALDETDVGDVIESFCKILKG
ncbi:MAG: UDP-4-amino-4,6-dideoxy-N-acetyl-beta-L-altrosamine transaminase [Deltaproteobacteria bacterium]|nr:MAG: UDP-4-amino-4,6-dideoxy-N-acetyl-beta-L-altrosamine transaminase [Deltaproteobacteria bacterium]